MELTDPVTGLPVNLSDPAPADPLAEVAPVEEALVVEEKPKETVHYVHGTQVLLTDAQKEKLDELTKAMNDVGEGLSISDIPITHEYHIRKAELDAFVATLKH